MAGSPETIFQHLHFRLVLIDVDQTVAETSPYARDPKRTTSQVHAKVRCVKEVADGRSDIPQMVG